jgi:hypothetical protein
MGSARTFGALSAGASSLAVNMSILAPLYTCSSTSSLAGPKLSPRKSDTLPSITDVTVVSGPYDLIIGAVGNTQVPLRESVVHHLSCIEDISRVLVCPVVGVRLPIAARVGG